MAAQEEQLVQGLVALDQLAVGDPQVVGCTRGSAGPGEHAGTDGVAGERNGLV
jgi:hypothetical protein